MFDLHDKIAIVTGASQGIGKTISSRAIKKWCLCLLYQSK